MRAWTRAIVGPVGVVVFHEKGVMRSLSGGPGHAGSAGPAKLQTLIKFAIACGVGASLSVLQKRARDVTKLVMPYTPDDILAELAPHRDVIAGLHVFPLGGIKTAAEYLAGVTEGTDAGARQAP